MPKWRLAISICLFLIPACFHPLPQPIHLKFVFRGDLSEIETITSTIARFEKEYPRIKVDMDCPEYYLEHLIDWGRQPEAGVDVAFVEIHDFSVLKERDLFQDLGPFVAKDDFNLATYFPSILAQFTFQDNLLVLPRDIAPVCCVYFNKTLFTQAGLPYPRDDWRWPRDFLPVAQKLTRCDSHGNVTCYGFMDDWPLWDAFVLSNGGHYVDDADNSSRFMLDSPESVETLRFRQERMLKYRVMSKTQTEG
jgi:multiple sugar transport system substrate-binding protein